MNGQYTSDGGTHLSAFREGLLRGINDFANKKFSGDDVREGVLGAIAIRLKEPIFESQTKNKLGNSEIRSDLVTRIAQSTAQALHRNTTEAKKLIAKIEETQKLRKELNSVKKLARERSKAVRFGYLNSKTANIIMITQSKNILIHKFLLPKDNLRPAHW